MFMRDEPGRLHLTYKFFYTEHSTEFSKPLCDQTLHVEQGYMFFTVHDGPFS